MAIVNRRASQAAEGAGEAHDVDEFFADSPAQSQRGAERTVATEGKPSKADGFSAWASKRPFLAGLLMILAGAVILTPAYLSFEVSNIQIQIATMSGVSTLLIGVLLIASGLMTWFQREGRILTGLTALILAVVAIPTSNFGGFVIGALLALLGGAMALSWAPGPAPVRRRRRTRVFRTGRGSAAETPEKIVETVEIVEEK